MLVLKSINNVTDDDVGVHSEKKMERVFISQKKKQKKGIII